MTRVARRRLLLVARAAIVALVGWSCVHFARRLDLRAVGNALASASPALVAAAAALNLAQVYVRALCLRALLAPVRFVPSLRLLRYSFAFYAGNNLLPGRGGEWVRIALLKAREAVPMPAALAVAVVEKAFDALALGLLALPLPLLLPHLPRSVAAALVLLGGGGLAALAVAWVVARRGVRATGRLAPLAAGASVVRRPGPFATALGFSLAAYAMDAVMIALCLAAVGIHTDAAAPLLVLLALGVTLAVPSTPSGFGAFEIGAVSALHLLGVDGERALAFALVYHVMQVAPVTLIGLDGMRLATALVPSDEAR